VAALERSKAELEQSVVRSPQAGLVLEIHAKPGETVSQRGIADVGQTDRMQVVAEVYQCDIGRIRVGQRAEAPADNRRVTCLINLQVQAAIQP